MGSLGDDYRAPSPTELFLRRAAKFIQEDFPIIFLGSFIGCVILTIFRLELNFLQSLGVFLRDSGIAGRR
jgi:hypothetical protein